MEREKIAEVIRSGKAVLGMEFGSTRIKAVLVDPEGNPIGRSNGSPCVTESRSRRRPDKLFTYACNGTKRCRCYRYCSSSRCIHGNLWNLGGIENHGRSC